MCTQEIQRLECEAMTSSGGTLTHRHWRQICDRLDQANTDSSRETSTLPTSALTELSGAYAVDVE